MQVTQRKGLVTTAGPWGSVTGKRYLQQTQCGAGFSIMLVLGLLPVGWTAY